MPPVVQPVIFPDTRWSLILRLRVPVDDASAEQALNDLCQAYWQPLYVYLRRSGLDGQAAQDAVQGFLAQMLSRNGFDNVAPAKGRFRYFLLAALRHFLISEGRKETALKRGGGTDLLSLDVDKAEAIFQTQAGEQMSPEAAFDRQWAQTVWTRALGRLREEHVARGKAQVFDGLKLYLTEELGQNHDRLAAQLGLPANSVALGLHRLRRRLRELVLDELAETVGADADLNEELQYFLSIWSE